MKKSTISIIIGMLCCILFAGCGGRGDKKDATEAEKPGVAETASEAEKPGTEETAPDEEKPGAAETASDEEKPGTAEVAEDAEKPVSGPFARAFEKDLVNNNGSYFVGIDRKVYFRNISTESMEKGAAFGEFLSTEWTPVECPLICYDLDTCEWREAGKITGIGKLFACPDGFYIGEMNPESLDSYCTDLYDPKTGNSRVYCKGIPRGVSKSGKLLAVEQYGGQNVITAIVKDGEEIVSLGGENIFYEYCGFVGEEMIALLHTANDDYILCSVDDFGDVAELGRIGGSGSGYPEFKQLKEKDGEIYLTFGFFEGTGHFLSHWITVKAVPGRRGSLKEVNDGIDAYEEERDEEGPENDVPKLTFDTGDSLFYVDHLSYQAFMGDGDDRNNLYYYNDIYDKCLLVKDFIKNDYGEKCQIIQNITSSYDTVFAIYADAVMDDEYEIGWRTGYRLAGWHICAIPYGYGHEDEKGLAKEIIHFENGEREMIDDSSSDGGMLIPDSDKRELTEDDLAGFGKEELRIARNEIYARHGRKFSDKELQSHFDGLEWYVPEIDAKDFNEGMLSEIEKRNLRIIGEFEKK